MGWADLIIICILGSLLLFISTALLPVLYDAALRHFTATMDEWQRRRGGDPGS